ncbi:hypothetical protein [Candidatus Dormiibacter inghamiae]|uniref:hypothetical protein n=1 Tax=Candidatus Dormiibacter inghamiae TaxID=3127013 RepID=UPI0030C6BA09
MAGEGVWGVSPEQLIEDFRPRGWRQLCLTVGYVGLLVIALAALLTGDVAAFVLYLTPAIVGFLFLHTRVLTALIWSVVFMLGIFFAALGSQLGFLQALAAAGAFVIGVWPDPRAQPDPAQAGQQDESPSRPAPPPAPTPPLGVSQSWPPASSFPPPAAVAEPLPAAAPPPESQPTRAVSDRLQITTLGGFSVRLGENDFTTDLLEHPLLSFLWVYLLVRALDASDHGIRREALAEEAAPGVPTSEAMSRLRRRLHDLRHGLPAPLAERVVVGRDHVRLEIADCDIDLRRLQALAGRCRDAGELVDQQLAAEIEYALRSTSSGDFLPLFDQLEQRANDGRGVAGDLVSDLRQAIKLTADRSQRLAVFPGQHRVAIAGTSLLQAQQIRFDATEALPKLTPVQLVLKLTPAGQSSAAASIKDAMTRCAASGSLQPQGCPQNFSSVESLRDPHWQVVGDPGGDLAVALDPDHGLLAKGHFQMILAATEPVTGAVSHHAVGGAYQTVLAASADALTVQLLEASSAGPPLSRPAAATDSAVRDAVRQALAACATSTSFFTPDCPQFHVLNDIQDPTKNVQWHLSGDPAAAATVTFDGATGVIHAVGNFTMTLDYDQRLVGKDYPQHAEDSGAFQADLFWDGSKLVPVTISRPR